MSSLFAPAPAPPTKLGVLRILSPAAGAHVSPLCLGAMNVGDKWSHILGSMDKTSSFNLLDSFFDMGGNFIDTANSYQDESSEEFLGEWMEKRGIRDQIFLATKYSLNYKRGDDTIAQKSQFIGNNRKSMHISVDASLKKLRTSYIDVLYVHFWDYETSVKEVMDGLHILVMQGKVLYLGISDTPAWIVARANEYATSNGKTPFVIYQGKWNILERSFERDIIPMARSLGLALAPFGVVGQGKFRTDAEEIRRKESGEHGRKLYGGQSGDWQRTEAEVKISHALEKIAKEVGVGENIHAVAIAYVMQKAPYVFPIVGGRKVEHLQANIQALDILLSEEQIQYLESVVPFDLGFPHNILRAEPGKPNFMKLGTMQYKTVESIQPIKPTYM